MRCDSGHGRCCNCRRTPSRGSHRLCNGRRGVGGVPSHGLDQQGVGVISACCSKHGGESSHSRLCNYSSSSPGLSQSCTLNTVLCRLLHKGESVPVGDHG